MSDARQLGGLDDLEGVRGGDFGGGSVLEGADRHYDFRGVTDGFGDRLGVLEGGLDRVESP